MGTFGSRGSGKMALTAALVLVLAVPPWGARGLALGAFAAPTGFTCMLALGRALALALVAMVIGWGNKIEKQNKNSRKF